MLAARPVSRRRVLGGALGGLGAGVTLLSACDLSPPAPSATATASPSATPQTQLTRTAAPTTPEELDLPLAAGMLIACSSAADLVARTAKRHPRFAGALAPTLEVHRAHADLLAGAAEGARAAPTHRPVPARASAAWAEVLDLEQTLQGTLRRGALEAQSGLLARALASMSAAIAQQLTRLSPQPPREGR